MQSSLCLPACLCVSAPVGVLEQEIESNRLCQSALGAACSSDVLQSCSIEGEQGAAAAELEECRLKKPPAQVSALSPISICCSPVQCVSASREGHPSKRRFTPNQIEGLVRRIRFAALGAPWHASGNKQAPTQTNTHTHARTQHSFFYVTLDFFCPLFSAVLLFHTGGLHYAHLKAAECVWAAAMRA